MNNSLTRARLKPVLMSGGYAQFTYAFNYWGPIGFNRDTNLSRQMPGSCQIRRSDLLNPGTMKRHLI